MNEEEIAAIARLRLGGPQDDLLPGRAESDSTWQLPGRKRRWRPPTDVIESEQAFSVVVEIAGMRGVEISVIYENRKVKIQGMRAEATSGRAYHQMEIAYGEFETTAVLPAAVDVSRAEATYTDGFLRVLLPKSKSKSVTITD